MSGDAGTDPRRQARDSSSRQGDTTQKSSGWPKTIALMRKVRHRGFFKVGWIFIFCAWLVVSDQRGMQRANTWVTREIIHVERQNRGDCMHQHDCHQMRIVRLLAGDALINNNSFPGI